MTKLQLWLYMRWAELSVAIDKVKTGIDKYFVKAHAEKFLAEFRSTECYQKRLEDNRQMKVRLLANPNCKHLKGGRLSIGRDYNLALHTFADGRTKMWCLNHCGFKLWDDEVGFSEARILMITQSTNKPSSSERVFSGKEVEEYIATCQDIVTYQDKI